MNNKINSKIDIIIPYFNETANQFLLLRNNLLSQTIIQDCQIYLISDKSYMDQYVINIFNEYNNKLHCIFLRNEEQLGPGGARNKGIENSYGPYILFFDADNAFIKTTALEEIYNKAINYDLIDWINYSKTNNIQYCNFCVKRSILEDNNLYYKNIFFGEDLEFYIRLIASVHEINVYNYNNKKNIFIEYNATSIDNNITSTFWYYDKFHFSSFSSFFIGFMSINNINKQNQSIIESNLIYVFNLLNNNNYLSKNIFVKSLIWYELYELQKKYKNITNLKYFQLICEILSLDFSENENTIKTFLSNYIKENYLNNKKTKECSKIMLSLLSV